MKKEVANYIAQCLECQKVKVDHKYLEGMLQPFPITVWKWEVVTIDFITKMTRIMKHNDSIMVVVDRFTKTKKFIPVKTIHKETNITFIYMKEVASLHGVPKAIVPYRDPKFTSKF
jgi:hypothetical protein